MTHTQVKAVRQLSTVCDVLRILFLQQVGWVWKYLSNLPTHPLYTHHLPINTNSLPVHKTMLARSIVRQAVRGVRNVSTKQSSSNGAFNGVYNTFMKSNVAYVSTIIVAAVAVEMVYGTTTSYVWESVNRGVCKLIV